MTKSEALEFLELPETATESEIKIRVEDKLAYFERLSEKAPSDFLRRLHARNAAKVSEIQMASRKWPSYIPPVGEQREPQPEPALPPEAVAVSQPEPELVPEQAEPEPVQKQAEPELQSPAEPESLSEPEPASDPEPPSEAAPILQQGDPAPILQQREPEPVLLFEPSREFRAEPEPSSEPKPILRQHGPAPTPQQREPEPVLLFELPRESRDEPQPDSGPVREQADPLLQSEPVPVAWLIRHTENQSSKTFPLYPGKNFLGRKPKDGLTPFIEVEEDPYISKVHAVLYAENGDISVSDPTGEVGKPSKNGIFINADDNRLTAKTRLWENDTIQIGVTKLILRHNNKAIVKIVREVEELDYMHTVVIDIS